MKLLLTLIFLSALQSSYAETILTSVHSISQGEMDEPYIIRLNNGRASFLSKNKGHLIGTLRPKNDKNQLLKIFIDHQNHIYEAHYAGEVPFTQESKVQLENKFEPTIVKNTSAARKLFRKMRRDYTKSGECFNRAHIWTVEAYQKSDAQLSKIFMFFTDKYIRRYKFHWWFHVTPMVYVGNMKQPRTLDRRYSSGPKQTKTWSNIFIKSKRTCKIVKKFDDYFLNQQKEDCYHIYTSMYYYVPRDIEKRDLTGIDKVNFLEKEIKKAYKNGFKIRRQ